MPALNLKQATEVARRQAKARESQGNPDILMKLESAEAKLQDLKSNMTILGKEAASALASVEDQQQKLTLERLLSMVVWLVTSSIVRSTLFYVPICTSFETTILFIPDLRLNLNVPTIKEPSKYLISLKGRLVCISFSHSCHSDSILVEQSVHHYTSQLRAKMNILELSDGIWEATYRSSLYSLKRRQYAAASIIWGS